MVKRFITEFNNSFTVAIGKEEKEIDLFFKVVYDEYSEEWSYVVEIDNKCDIFDDQENAEWFIENYLEKLFCNIESLRVRVSLLDNDLSVNFYCDEDVTITTNMADFHAYSFEESIWFTPEEQYTDYGDDERIGLDDLDWFDGLLDELFNI